MSSKTDKLIRYTKTYSTGPRHLALHHSVLFTLSFLQMAGMPTVFFYAAAKSLNLQIMYS